MLAQKAEYDSLVEHMAVVEGKNKMLTMTLEMTFRKLDQGLIST